MATTANSKLTTTGTKKLTFTEQMEKPGYKALINSAIKDPKRANRFVTAVISAVSANELLQRCDAKSILSAALQGEALGLSPSPALGEYWMVPYRVGKPDFQHPENDVYRAQFQLGVNGIVQLAMRTGLYLDIDAMEIHEGEYKGRDKRTGRAIIEFYEDDSDREEAPVVGYYAYFELQNGFFHSVYWSKNEVIKWTDRYSKAFDSKLYEKYTKGEITDWKEQQKCSSPWYERFSEMACNTMLKRCLKRAPKSIELQTALEAEENTIEADISETFTETPAVPGPADDPFEVVSVETVPAEDTTAKKTTTRKSTAKKADAELADDPFFDV